MVVTCTGADADAGSPFTPPCVVVAVPFAAAPIQLDGRKKCCRRPASSTSVMSIPTCCCCCCGNCGSCFAATSPPVQVARAPASARWGSASSGPLGPSMTGCIGPTSAAAAAAATAPVPAASVGHCKPAAGMPCCAGTPAVHEPSFTPATPLFSGMTCCSSWRRAPPFAPDVAAATMVGAAAAVREELPQPPLPLPPP